MAWGSSGDSFEKKVLELDITIRRRNYITKGEDDGLTNYTDLNIKNQIQQQKEELLVSATKIKASNEAFSGDLLSKMDKLRQKSSQSTADTQ